MQRSRRWSQFGRRDSLGPLRFGSRRPSSRSTDDDRFWDAAVDVDVDVDGDAPMRGRPELRPEAKSTRSS